MYWILLSAVINVLTKNDAECVMRVVSKTGKEAAKFAGHTSPTITTQLVTLISITQSQRDAVNTSHEHAVSNTILGNTEKNFQHPSYVRKVCENENCINKICETPCTSVVKEEYVAHGTHNGEFPSAVFLSQSDLARDSTRPQYGIFYSKPIENTDSTLDDVKSKTLNNDKTHVNNVHMNSSKEVPDKSHLGTFNPDENLN